MIKMLKKIRQQLTSWATHETQLTIEEVFEQSNPQSTSIDGPNGELKFTNVGDDSRLFVQTPTGFSKIKRALKTVPYNVYTVKTASYKLRCADEHIVISEAGEEILVKDLLPGTRLKTLSGIEEVVDVISSDSDEVMYDLELDDEDHVYYTSGILSHNTATAAMFLLWKATFIKDQTILIASKNQSHAMEIAARVRFAYEELPNWIKCGVKYYNRHRIEFDNGSRIICEATTEKTGRGLSVSCLTAEAMVELEDVITGEILTVSMAEAERMLENEL